MTSADDPDYRIAVMSADEVRLALQWAQDEGWNPGLQDARLFHAADPSGFFIGRWRGEPVATISAVKYGAGFGFIGLYIVPAAFRGQGFGLRLWQAAMASLAGRNVGLDGVPAQQENYRRSGFSLAHRNVRYAGRSMADAQGGSRAQALADGDLPTLQAYDRAFFPDERSAFLRRWVDPAHAHTRLVVEEAQVRGYGVIRPCHQGYKIGPLQADRPDVAEALFLALAASVPVGSELYLDVPEPNQQAVELARRFGMAPVFETARMYTAQDPGLPLQRIYGITTFELG